MNTSIINSEFPALNKEKGAARYDWLLDALEESENCGLVSDLPEEDEIGRGAEVRASRIHTICVRLNLLGYINNKKENENWVIDDAVQSAIRKFQLEAPPLKVDGWALKNTWQALDQLVGFESHTALPQWYINGHPKPALKRAINLRLFILGFLNNKQPKPSKESKKVRQALEEFVAIAKFIGLAKPEVAPNTSIETIELLFNQDAITNALAAASWSSRKTPSRFARFIDQSAKIELWLHGYDVKLEDRRLLKSPKKGENTRRTKFRFYRALKFFWIHSGKSVTNAAVRARHIEPKFFKQLSHDGDKDPTDAEQLHKETYDEIFKGNESKTLQLSIEKNLRSIGSRMWDGVKRAWRWFKRFIDKKLKLLRKWGRNLARLIHHTASRVFADFRDIVRALRLSIHILKGGDYGQSDPQHVVIRRDQDFDYRLYLNADGDPKVIDRIMNHFTLSAKMFGVSMKFLGSLLETIVSMASKFAQGVFGWFRFIVSLSRHAAKIRASAAELLILIRSTDRFVQEF